ncbi:GNAT family N-acetyltransferase [Mucilaginibacter sp.]|uniref:GNAT family N-acetyltransferase n=1 Tax=Mucilaginibacter sp. TaxID=1882438 RepID=UPI00374D9F62
MNYAIYLRPLRVSDAQNNVKWDTDTNHRKHTREMSEQYMPLDIEVGWLSYILGSTTDKCFAICLNFTDRHIGNIELTNISDHDAQCNILIGEKEFRGKGIATKAMQLISEFAFSHLKLKQLYRTVYQKNDVDTFVCQKCVFIESESKEINPVMHTLSIEDYCEKCKGCSINNWQI